MGQAMVANLLKAGHSVRVWNRSPGPVEHLASLGAKAVGSAGDAFGGDAVLSMLADDAAVRSVVVDHAALAHAPRGLVHVNLATVSVQLAQEMTALHRERGLVYLAAPVFGRPEVAAAAKLNVVVAGDAAAIDRVQPLFDAIGQKTWRFGDDPVRANAVKLAGNFLIACAIESIAESTAMAAGYGVTPGALVEMLTATLFNSPIYNIYGGLIAQRRFEPPGFKLRLGLKDVRLALAAGEGVNTPMPFGSVVRDALIDALAHGEGDLDWTAMSKVTYRRAGREDGQATGGVA